MTVFENQARLLMDGIGVEISDEETADFLADAQKYLEENGWWRGSLLGPNGHQACALGALLFSHELGVHDAVRPQVRAAVSALESLLDVPYVDLTEWNDTMAKNKQDVIDLMARAEKILRTGYDPDEGITNE